MAEQCRPYRGAAELRQCIAFLLRHAVTLWGGRDGVTLLSSSRAGVEAICPTEYLGITCRKSYTSTVKVLLAAQRGTGELCGFGKT